MKPLTPAQRRALRWGSAKGGVHVGTGADAPERRVQKQTARQLVALGLARQDNDTLLTLKAGKVALDVPTVDPPVYLHARDGLTTERHRAVQGEAEVIDPETLKPFWREQAERRSAAGVDNRAAARSRADRAKRAA